MKPARYGKRRPNPAVLYLDGLKAGRSRETMRGHVKRLASLVSGGALDWHRFPWARLTYRDTQRLRAHLADRYAPAGANVRLAALRGVLREAWRLGQMKAEAYHRAIDLPNVRGDSKQRGRALDPEEVGALVQQARSRGDAKGLRDAAIFAVLFGTGCRRSELVGVTLPEDLDLERRTLTLRTKGSKHRTVDLQPPVAQAVAAWARNRGPEPGPLFQPITRYGVRGQRALTPEAILRLGVHYGRLAGLRYFSPHDFRRTFVSQLLDAGVDLHVVSEMADHADVRTTARYDPQRDRRRQAAAGRLPCLF